MVAAAALLGRRMRDGSRQLGALVVRLGLL